MLAECSVQFHFCPHTAAWTTSASLSLSAELLGYRTDGTSRPPNAEYAEAELQLLLYVSRFHQVQEVSLEEVVEGEEKGLEETHVYSPRTGSGAAFEAALSTPMNSFQKNKQEDRRRVRTVLHDYKWCPCPHPIKHQNLREDGDLKSSQPAPMDTVEQAADKLDAPTGVHETAESPQPLFLDIVSAIPSSVGRDSNEEEEEEADNDRDQQVLQSGPLSPSSTEMRDTAQSRQEGVTARGEEVNRKAPRDLELRHSSLAEPAQFPPPGEKNVLTATEQTTPSSLSVFTAESTAATISAAAVAAPSQYRLVLRRPGNTKEGTPALPIAAVPSVEALPPLPNAAEKPQRRRVLNINTAVKLSSPLPPPTSSATAPASFLSPPSTSTKPCRFVEEAHFPLTATAAILLPQADKDPEDHKTEGSPEQPQERESWTPYVFSFTYGSLKSNLSNTSPPVDDNNDGKEQRPPLSRRLAAVHLTFKDVSAVNSTLSNIKCIEEVHSSKDDGKDDEAQNLSQTFWSRASVASCGAFTRRSSFPSITVPNSSRSNNGYAFILGDVSLQTCWICPLAAPILETAPTADGAGDGEDESNTECAEGATLIAGPLVEARVAAVSAHVRAQVEQPSIKKEQQDGEDNRMALPKPEEPTTDSSVLPCLHFTPSWLSQLSCTFGPSRLLHDAVEEALVVPSSEVRESGLFSPRATCVQWPSTNTAGLTWTAAQITADCTVLYPFFSSLRDSAGAPERSDALCVCLQSDVCLMDATYAYFLELQSWWLREMGPLDASRSETPFTHAVKMHSQSPQIVLTRIAPATLSLRGGALGSSSGVVLAEEAVRAANFTGKIKRNGEVRGTECHCAAATLRARVAVTAAIVQHFLWKVVEAFEADGDAPSARDVKCEGAMALDGRKGSFLLKACEAVDMRRTTTRFDCVARALALQWVWRENALTFSQTDAVQQFLAEESLILSSASSLGQLIQASSYCATENQRVSPTMALQLLHSLQQRYTASSLAALFWLSRHTSDMQWLRCRGVAIESLLTDQRKLCLWALQSHISLERGFSSLQLADKNVATLQLGNDFAFPQSMYHLALSCMHTPENAASYSGEPRNGCPTPLRGRIDVRIQHAPVLNALRVQLDWKTASPCSPTGLAAIAGNEAATAVELPFFLFVFVLKEAKEEEEWSEGASTAENSSEASDKEDYREDVTNARGNNGSVVRLYQVTPFSWNLPAQHCTTAGSTAHLSLSVMHALDLAARRPDAFDDFNRQAMPGVCRTAEGNKAQSRGEAAQRRGAARNSLMDNQAVRARKGRGRQQQPRGQATRGAPSRKRRRTRHSSDDEDVYSSDDATSEDSKEDGEYNEDKNAFIRVAEDKEEREKGDEDDEDDTLFLNLGGRAGRKAGKSVASTRRHGAAVQLSSESFSVLDTARAIPLVVFRKDGTTPLVEVELHHAELLATWLLTVGYNNTLHDRQNMDDCNSNSVATSTLCSLLSHLSGFATASIAVPESIAQLRERQERASLLSLSAAASYASVSALTELNVLSAYKTLIQNILKELSNTAETCIALSNAMAVDTLFSHVLSSTQVMASVRAALNEYARLDAACRAFLLTYELEAEADDVLWVNNNSNANVASTICKRSNTKEKQQQEQRRRKAEQHNDEEVAATWTFNRSTQENFVSTFYNCVLPSFMRKRCATLLRPLSNRRETTTHLEKWRSGGQHFNCLSDEALREKFCVLQSCDCESQLNLKVGSQGGTLSTAMPPPSTNSTGSALRMQLGAKSTPTAAPNSVQIPSLDNPRTHFQCPAATPFVMGLTPPQKDTLTFSKLRDLCSAHLAHSSLSSSVFQRSGNERKNRMETSSDCVAPSHEAALHLLGASADVLMVSSDARPLFSANVAAAASLGLSVVQLSSSDVQEGR